jgi:hypothetical protein
MPESDMGATPVEGETGKLKYFDIPCSRNSRPTMMRNTLSTRGDHVARKLSIAGIIISPMNKLRGHRLAQRFYNLARGAQGIYRENRQQHEEVEAGR